MRLSKDELRVYKWFHEWDVDGAPHRFGFRGTVYLLPNEISLGVGYNPKNDSMEKWRSYTRESDED